MSLDASTVRSRGWTSLLIWAVHLSVHLCEGTAGRPGEHISTDPNTQFLRRHFPSPGR